VDEFALALATFLVMVTVVAAAEYYRQLRRAQKEYEKARGAVEDIVLSFNRQFRREGEKLEAIAYKVEATASRSSSTLNMIEDIGKRIGALETKVAADSESKNQVIGRLHEAENRIRDVSASQDAVTARITSLEKQTKQPPPVPEAGLEAVIPIRREKAMSRLTDTELSVLELLASEGPKTAPEIKERVKLSREHTARLMKKLYEEGYLERETGKIPFKYTVKKEMEKLLKKTETLAT
jgi:DNA-binding CsgD family transcriptional regulator